MNKMNKTKLKLIKDEMQRRRKNTRYLTLQNIATVVNCKKSGDYTEAKNTNLYIYNSSCYCELLEVIGGINA